jgi:hypothetical protein
MNKTILPLIATALIGMPALAMGAGVESLDTNADGMLSFTEVQAAWPEVTEDIFAQIDMNDDGLLDVDEVAAAQEAGVMPVANEG